MKRALVVAALLAACAVHASDGVIEINHAKVMAAGGYPYRITQPGSYRLTSNLTQPDADTNVIEIQASDVTLDLNGFAITGANVCTYSAGPPPSVSCSGLGDGLGVDSLQPRVTVRNGSVTGVGFACMRLGQQALAHDLSISHCGASGISLVSGTIGRVLASYNRWEGIFIYGGTVSDSAAMYNGAAGIYIFLWDAVVRHSHSTGNVGSGIGIYNGTVIGNVVGSNGGAGLEVTSQVSYSGNSIRANAGGATLLGGGAFLLNGGGNVCDGAACP